MGLTRNSNFALSGKRPVFAVAGVLWSLALAAIGGVVVLVSDTRTLVDEVAQLNDHISRLTQQSEELKERAETAPDVGALRAQSERVLMFNSLTGPRQMPLIALLALLETQLPQNVWISQLNYNVETGRLSVSLRTDDEAELPVALRALEQASDLRDVILERQLRLQQGGRQLAQYDIEARAL